MGNQYAEITFTESVKAFQTEKRSRKMYSRMEQGEDTNFFLGEQETDFIRNRDSFYIASVSETDWPYVQHRGGPVGFVKVLDGKKIGFADFVGNRQYISAGNFKKNNRVALFFMDYPNQMRLKVMGHVRTVEENEYQLLAELEPDDYRARIDRGYIITIKAFDWNCPQHITPRYTKAEFRNKSGLAAVELT